MSAHSFKEGDQVLLKSGSPKLTVEMLGMGAEGDPLVSVTWFDGGEVRRDRFHHAGLRYAPITPASLNSEIEAWASRSATGTFLGVGDGKVDA